MKFVVTNTVLSNAGDAAIFEGIYAALRGDTRISVDELVIFDSNAHQTQPLYPELDIRQQYAYPRAGRWVSLNKFRKLARVLLLRSLTAAPAAVTRAITSLISTVLPATTLARALSGYSDADVVISSGGTYLVDHYNFGPRVDELSFAKTVGAARTILWTQSVGPFTDRKAHANAQRLAKYVDSAHFRDKRSQDAWTTAVGLTVNVTVNADAAFMLDPPPEVPDNAHQVIFSVRDWKTGLDGQTLDVDQYEDAYRTIVQQICLRALTPVAISTCQGLPGYNIDDSVVAARIFAGTATRIDGRHRSPDQLMAEIRKSALVVTTRMHLAILALICRVPVIAVAYEFKTIDLFNSVGLAECAIPIEDFTSSWLAGQVDRVLDEPGRWTLSAQQVSDLRESARVPAMEVAG